MRITKDLHTHCNLAKTNHAKGSAEEYAKAAKLAGLKEFAITNHGYMHPYGMIFKNYDKDRAEVKAAGALFGIEANIVNQRGHLDLKGKQFDIVIVGFHKGANYFRFLFKSKKANTQMYINAIKKNKIDIIAHLNAVVEVDCEAVAKVAKENGVMIELNNKNMAFTKEDFLKMQATGVKFIISSDSHKPDDIGKVDRVFEFLNTVDFNPKQIVNLEV